MIQKGYGTQEYRQQEVMGASPIRLVVMAYDMAILSCEKQDFTRSTKAVSLLRDALNFDYTDTSMGLFKLYQWVLDCIRQGDYGSAVQTLRELRDAWVSVEKRMNPTTVTAPAVQPHYASVPAY